MTIYNKEMSPYYFKWFVIFTPISYVISNIDVNCGGGQVRGQVGDDGDVLDLDVLGDGGEEDGSVNSGVVKEVEIVCELVIS